MEIEARPKMIGARVQRLEDPRMLTGHGRFLDDINLPGTLHIAFCRSDHGHARIMAIDSAEAAGMSGVAAVITAADIEGLVKTVRATSTMAHFHGTELPVLANDKVRHVGEPVVAVLAASRYLAEDAAERIVVTYEALPTVIDPVAAAEPDSPLLHEEIGSNVLIARTFERGEVDPAMAAAPVSVGGSFRMHRKTPVAMENRGYLADYDQGRGSLHSTTQVPGIVRDTLVQMLDLPGNRLRVVAPDVGGGFGGKTALYREEVLVCVLARKFGRPVKWLSDRLEDLISTSQAFDEIVEAELACDEDGNILGLRAEVIGDVGAYSGYPWSAAIEPVQVVSFLPGPYRVENYRGRVRGVATSKSPMGAYRGVGRPISTFVMERLIDMAAARLSIDPLEMRRRNMVRAEEFPYKSASGIVWDRAGFLECLEQACDGADYGALRQQQAAARQQGRWVGIGLASYVELTGLGSRIAVAPGMPVNTGTETATVRIDSTGAVTAYFGIASHGQGLETTLAQIIAEELGARLQDIEVLHGDSDIVAHGTGTYASRSAVLAGGAAIFSARAVREQVLRAASHILEADAGDIDAANGEIFVKGTDRSLSFRELARAVYTEVDRLPRELREDIELQASNIYDPYFGTATPATHLALVEVDPETFGVTVQRYVVADDCGRIINPLIADGQVHGGVAQGIGAALLEEVVYDETGQILTASLMDYVVPTAAEIPAMEVFHLETELPGNIGGFRGLGEGGTIGAPAAIANAIADAVGHLDIDINELPMTPERLFRLVSKQQE